MKNYNYSFFRILRRYSALTKYTNNSLYVLKQLEKIYWDLEANITPLVVNKLNKEVLRLADKKKWIAELTIKAFSGQEVLIESLIRELHLFRNKLTALRVGVELIPDLKTELVWNCDNRSFSLESITLLTKFFVGEYSESGIILKELKQNFSDKIIIRSHRNYPSNQLYEVKNKLKIVIREYVEDKSTWTWIFKDIYIDKIFNSLLLKIQTINLIEKVQESKISGIDGVCFKKKIKINLISTQTGQNTFLQLKKIHPAFKLKSLAKGTNSLAIQRRGKISSLNEGLRKVLQKHTLGKTVVALSKMELNKMRYNPKTYITNHNILVKKLNTGLKYELLKGLKLNALLEYNPKIAIRVKSQKNYGKLKISDVPTLYDRLVHKYMTTVIEPYMETVDDQNSWGFRQGKWIPHAILQTAAILKSTNLYTLTQYQNKIYDILWLPKIRFKLVKYSFLNILNFAGLKITYNKNSVKKIKTLTNHIKYVLSIDIQDCFNEINHDWLLKWVPLVEPFKTLFYKILKTRVVEEPFNKDNWSAYLWQLLTKHSWLYWGVFKNNLVFTNNKNNTALTKNKHNKGVLLEESISPLLVNWALSGLSCVVKKELVAKLDKKKVFIKASSPVYIVRFIDSLLLISLSQEKITDAMLSIKKFLKVRGLKLFDDKVQIVPITLNKKITFIGWTFHTSYPKKLKKLLYKNDYRPQLASRDAARLYVYPSKESIKNLRRKVKNITSIKFIGLDPSELIYKLNSVISAWSNYFLLTINGYSLKSYLDWYIFLRCKRWCYKKYGKKGFANSFKNLFYDIIKNKRSTLVVNGLMDKQNFLYVKSLREFKNLFSFYSYRPNLELKSISMFIDSKPHIYWALKLIIGWEDVEACIAASQEFSCSICRKSLLEINKLDYFSNSNNTTYYNAATKKLSEGVAWKIKEQILNRGVYTSLAVPKKFINEIKKFKLIHSNLNLTSLHFNCYKLKERVGQKYFLSSWETIGAKLYKTNTMKALKNVLAVKYAKCFNNQDFLTMYLNQMKSLYNERYIKRIQAVIIRIKDYLKN
nr:hypothetical protein [Porphyridium purpureum]UBY46121.1 hypothetical protein [Porphyridium purpureum]